MESQDRRKNNPSGNGVQVCNKCGWLYPNSHPSAKQRRSHKRVCGTVKSVNNGDHKAHLDSSDNDSKTLKTMEKIEDMTVSSRSISGFGSGSNRSNRSEEDVFSDAVADFSEGVSDSDDVSEPAKNQDFSEKNDVADAGSGETHNIDVSSQYHLPNSTLDSSSDSGLALREEESSVCENLLQCSKISADLGHEEKENVKGVQDKNSEDNAITLTENACSPTDEQIDSLESSSQEHVGNYEQNLTKEFFPNMSMVEPTERIDNISGDVIFDALHQKDNFSEEVFVRKETEKTDSHATDEAKTIAKEHNSLVLAEELVFVEKETEKNGSHATDEDKTITEERNPLVFAGPSENSVKNSTDIISEALHMEDDFVEEVSVEKETEKSDSHATDADVFCQDKTNLQSVLDDSGNHSNSVSSVKPVNDDDSEHDNKTNLQSVKEAREVFPLTNETSSISDICNSMEKNLLREGNGDDDYELMAIDCSCDAQIKKLQDSEEAVKDLGSPSELMAIEQSVNVADEVNVASNSVDASLTENDKDSVVQLEKIEVSGVKELENAGEYYCFGKVDLGLISDNDDISESTQNAANSLNAGGVHGEWVSSALTDIQADSISQIDSIEGNWRSISVLSTLSDDAPAATETGSQPAQESFKPEIPVLQPKSNNGKSAIFQPQSSISSDKTNQNEALHKPEEHDGSVESSGKKRNEGIIAKVANWSTGKQHMPLKSYLGESSSPGSKEDPPQMSQEINDAVMAAKEQVGNEARVELSKEWNSPARYQSNIKREKSKVKRPYWAPFSCCSFVQTS